MLPIIVSGVPSRRACVVPAALLAVSTTLGLTAMAPVHAQGPPEDLAGASRVIVGLRLPWRAEGLATASERSRQRVAIASAQARLMKALRGTGAEMVRSYETIPFQALTVTPAALDLLRASTLVSSIEPDRLWRPTLAESVPLIEADQA